MNRLSLKPNPLPYLIVGNLDWLVTTRFEGLTFTSTEYTFNDTDSCCHLGTQGFKNNKPNGGSNEEAR